MADDRHSDTTLTPGAVRGAALTVEERKALLARAIFDQTREARATLQGQGEFEATIVRSVTVGHGLHLQVVGLLAVVAVVISQLFQTGQRGLIVALTVPGLYSLWWVFLTITAGDELQQLAVDEWGTVTSTRSGRRVETRGNILRVAIPGIVVAAAAMLAVSLSHDIAYPPPPNCNVPVTDQPDSCLSLSFLGSAVVGQYVPTATPAPSASAVASPSPAATPAPSSSAGPSATAAASGSSAQGFSVSQTIAIERIIRVFQLVIALAVCLGAAWFLRRMLTGQWVAFISPIGRTEGDD